MKNVRFEILEQNEVGAVATCNRCDQLHIEIGAFTSVVSAESFEKICAHMIVKKHVVNDLVVKTPTSEKILMPVGCNNFLSLTPSEYLMVIDLFELALHMHAAKKLMQL